jgi:hypothetical protein
LAPEVYKFAKHVWDDDNTLDPWDWSLINFTLAAFVFRINSFMALMKDLETKCIKIVLDLLLCDM